MYINSVLNSFSIMKAFLGRERSLTLKAISQQARMPPSKVHRYLQSLISCGMVSQNFESGRYGLGPMAIEYGLAGLSKIDPVRNACRVSAVLAEKYDVAVAVAVFSSTGPVFVFYEDSESASTQHSVRIGAPAPVLSGSTGQIFLAYLPRPRILAHLHSVVPPESRAAVDIDGMIHRVRTAGYSAETAGEARHPATQGGYSLSAPVFDTLGDLSAVVTFFDHRDRLLDPEAPYIRALLDETRRLSLTGGQVLRRPGDERGVHFSGAR